MYRNYEISNYSQKGVKSKHNSSYWKNKSYIGYGPGAHSYDKKNRYWNLKDNEAYISKIKNNEDVYEREVLSQRDKLNEYIITRIRELNMICVCVYVCVWSVGGVWVCVCVR